MSRLRRRWVRGWELLLRHRDPCLAYARAGWPQRRRLDLAVLLLGLTCRGTWRALGLAAALGLLLLAGRWHLGLEGRVAILLVPVLTTLPWLPLLAHARLRLLRALLAREHRRLACARPGCCNGSHADAGESAAGAGRARRAAADRGDRRGRAAGGP